ncbi:hypothetical protein BHM03_00040542 [Ensete ventricosum]|nr:hypothetical protein BHM03_00040542 [Ensete ventricosum]
MEGGTELTTEVKSTNALPSIESHSDVPAVQKFLQNILLVHIQKLLTSDTEKVNVNISLAAIKVLKLLPVEIMESQLSSIVHQICTFLKNRLESIRDEARSALAACVKELGLEYLQFVVKILKAILKRGYELHVLGYTLNFILLKTLSNPAVGKLDYCLDELLFVAENDILGDVAEEKEVDKIASKMKETRKKKSFETLKLISQSITFRTHAMKLLSPIKAQLQKYTTPKMKVRLEMMLQHIALGIGCNSSVELSELFIFVYGLIEDGISPERSHVNEISTNGINKKPVHDMSQNRDTSSHCKLGPHNSHLIVVFALGLLHNRLKNMKLAEDEQLLSMLDPFVKLLGDCLSSKYEGVMAASFRCLAPLVRLPLPSLQGHADKIKILLLEIAQKSGNVGSPLVQSCLKLLTVLLRSTRISLSKDQLHMLIQFPVFIDLQTKPSPVALSLLKSIVDRKLVVHEIYDIVMRVAELMVTSHSEPIRKKSSQVLFAISTCTARYGRYIRSARLSVRGPPATGWFRQKSTVGGRLKKKSTVDGRLREKSTVGGRLRKKKGRRRGKEKKKREERIPRPPAVAARGRLRAVAARGSPVCGHRPRVAHGRFFSRTRRRSVSPRGETDRGDVTPFSCFF